MHDVGNFERGGVGNGALAVLNEDDSDEVCACFDCVFGCFGGARPANFDQDGRGALGRWLGSGGIAEEFVCEDFDVGGTHQRFSDKDGADSAFFIGGNILGARYAAQRTDDGVVSFLLHQATCRGEIDLKIRQISVVDSNYFSA